MTDYQERRLRRLIAEHTQAQLNQAWEKDHGYSTKEIEAALAQARDKASELDRYITALRAKSERRALNHST